MKTIKRDGTEEDFNLVKIINAVKKANNSKNVENKISDSKIEEVVKFVENNLKDKEVVYVDEIHKLVENSLMNYDCYDVAREYISCRKERDSKRYENLEITKSIIDKINATNVQNQNANVDEYSFGGRRGEATNELMKKLALDYFISSKFSKNHLNNRVYIHDLDSYIVGMHNCLSIPIDDLLKNGIKTRQVFIRPANSVNTAMQIVAITMQLQSLQQFGGVSVTHLDWSMVPYVRKSFMKHFKDGLKYAEGKNEKQVEKIVNDMLEKDN